MALAGGLDRGGVWIAKTRSDTKIAKHEVHEGIATNFAFFALRAFAALRASVIHNPRAAQHTLNPSK